MCQRGRYISGSAASYQKATSSSSDDRRVAQPLQKACVSLSLGTFTVSSFEKCIFLEFVNHNMSSSKPLTTSQNLQCCAINKKFYLYHQMQVMATG